MMPLLNEFRARGFEVYSTGDKLFVEPRDELTAAEVAEVRANKPELLALAAADPWNECRKCRAEFDSEFRIDVIATCNDQPCQIGKKKCEMPAPTSKKRSRKP